MHAKITISTSPNRGPAYNPSLIRSSNVPEYPRGTPESVPQTAWRTAFIIVPGSWDVRTSRTCASDPAIVYGTHASGTGSAEVSSLASRTRRPIGFSLGKYLLAKVSFTTATLRASLTSASVNTRPAFNSTRSTRKYPSLTYWNSVCNSSSCVFPATSTLLSAPPEGGSALDAAASTTPGKVFNRANSGRKNPVACLAVL